MLIRTLSVLALLVLPLHAQEGDKKDSPGEKQVSRVPAEKIPPAPVLTPEEALKSFKLAPGFRIELVASEPLVHDPVAMAFDSDGRIWVAEMRGYMRDYEGTGERDPVGTIAVLEDTDGDGKMDKRTVFLDGLAMPRAVALVRGGVLVAEPPHVWFCKDTNGDLKSDEKREIIKDYGDTKNPEHTANGLLWAMDNWIYNADWTTRFKSMPEDEWKREPTAFRGQWGISQDDFGRLAYNNNSDQFRMDLVPAHYLARNPHYPDAVGKNYDPIRNQTTWPIRVTPGVNRGYRDGVLREDGTLSKFTAACSPLFYRGENFPAEFYGNAFVCEPSANLIKRNILVEQQGEVRGWQAYTNAEFLASTDERFRPVNLNNGPDGAMYIVDMYRGVIQHKIFLTTYLREQSESRGLEKPIECGRIYRIVHEKTKLNPGPKLGKRKAGELVDFLSHPNGWVRDTAQQLLVERSEVASVEPLKEMSLKGENPLGRLHALWTLEGIGELNAEILLAAYKDSHPKVRAAAIRLSESFLKSDQKEKFFTFLLRDLNNPNHSVQLQLALTLGEVVDGKAEAGMSIIGRNSSTNIFIRDAIVSGLYKRELEFLEKIIGNKAWDDQKAGSDDLLQVMAQCIYTEGKAIRLNRMFELAATARDWQREALLNGMASMAPVSKSKTPPKIKAIRFDVEPAGFKQLSTLTNKTTAGLVTQIKPLIAWPGLPNYVAPPVVKALSEEDKKRFEVGRELYGMVCAACHQSTGHGMEGIAPPLLESEWVSGSDERLARILLHGVRGPISVKGKTWEMEMPGLPFFDDEQIAGILTYIRREWEHTADPVSPDTIKKIRESTSARTEAWSEGELLKVP